MHRGASKEQNIKFCCGIVGRYAVRLTEGSNAGSPSQPTIQWVLRFHTPEAKRPGCKADHLPRSGAEGKNAWNFIVRSVMCLPDVHRDYFTLIKYVGYKVLTEWR